MYGVPGRGVLLGVGVLAMVSLAGCYESPSDVSLSLSTHESDASQYTGKTDPLLAKLETKDLRTDLRARFRRAQDR